MIRSGFKLFSPWNSNSLKILLKDVHSSCIASINISVDNSIQSKPSRFHLHQNAQTRLLHTSSFHYNDKPVHGNDTDTNKKQETKKSGRAGQLAKVFAEYGTTAVVFHTTISLTSLGICYMAVSSGIDVVALMQKISLISQETAESKLASGAGTFVVAYACHKVFMPARIFLTVSCTPVIVKRLRKMGFLKTVKNQEQ